MDARIVKKHHKILRKKNYGNATLYGGITEKGFPFWLPVYCPRPGQDQAYYQLLMKTVKMAEESWVKVGDRHSPSVGKIKLFDTKPRPKPKYDAISMFDLAFPDDFYIDDSDHPELKTKQDAYHWMNDIEEEDV